MGWTKPVAFLLLLASLQHSLPVICQTIPTVTLSENNSPLTKVLTAMRDQTGYTSFGDSSWPFLAKPVTLTVKNMPINRALDLCFKDQPLKYFLQDHSIQIYSVKYRVIHGWVMNEKNEAIAGATITMKGATPPVITSSYDNGEFRLHVKDTAAWLVVTSVGYEKTFLKTKDGSDSVWVVLKESITELAGASVTGHTGYQVISHATSTGSFTKVDNELVSRRVSPNILDRLDGVTSSVLFTRNPVVGINQSLISIRGRSTIFGNPDPLIAIDNFPYSGDINNINPEDVESITVLKDAAAASIWGAFSGNGVIVITTKKGRYNQHPKLSFNSSMTSGGKLNQFYQPILSSADYISVEQYLFGHGFYSGDETNGQHIALTPAVEILIKKRDSLITPAAAQAQLSALGQQDVRRDIDRYFDRSSLNQQYSLNLSGGGVANQYYFSAGYDKDLSNVVRNEYDRVTLDGSNTYILVPNRLELSTGLAFTASTTKNNNNSSITYLFPYEKLADAAGNPLPVTYQLRQSYADTAGVGHLLDWHYSPLDELNNADNSTKLTDYRINLGLKYTIGKGVSARLYYQYGRGNTDLQNYQSVKTYYTRNLINEFTQVNAGGQYINIVPLGGILDEATTSYQANNARAQLNYDHLFDTDGALSAIAGAEVRDVEGDIRRTRLYGYTKDQQNSQPVDYSDIYTEYSSGKQARIPYMDLKTATSDRFISYYINTSYTYLKRYILSASARRDESNLFGVAANQKGVPLWSVGGAWEISRENFYRIGWLPFLKLRMTNGYNGNVDRSVYALTTASVNPLGNTYGATSSSITNPPNPSLRWERIDIFNTGLDFASRGNRVSGSIEYYIKTGMDLIGQSPLDPTTGNTQFTGNTANTRTRGVDLNLHTKNIAGIIRWNTDLLFSLVRDQVTSYNKTQAAVINYLTISSLNPLVGHPLYSVYALRWKGLDPLTGDPQGILNGKISKDYNSITNSPDLSTLQYMGAVNPPFFGSLRNSVYWKQWGLSFNIIYKLGYVFRRNSIQYLDLFNGASLGHPDFDRRWQKSGDEKITNVPSMIYPANRSRDNFYEFSNILVEKADHIRLQDIQLSYDLSRESFARLPVQLIRFYVYANNIGILWKANHQGIDPNYVALIPNPRSVAFGVKVDF